MLEDILNRITINTQSSICIDGNPKIYFDPFRITDKPHDADLIFFTHAHYDHFSPDDFRKVMKEDTTFIAPKSMENDLEKAGIPDEKAVFLMPGEKTSIKGIKIETIPAYNIHKPMHKRKYGWLGYVIELDGVCIYDTGDIDKIPEGEDVKADIAFVPIGGTFTMNAKEAADFVNHMKPKVAVPIHYGSIVGRPSNADTFESGIEQDISVVRKLKF